MNTRSNKPSSKSNSRPDDEVRRLVVARLSTLSSDMSISLGGDGNFSRDDLIRHVEQGDEIGRALEEMQLEWLRSWKQRAEVQ